MKFYCYISSITFLFIVSCLFGCSATTFSQNIAFKNGLVDRASTNISIALSSGETALLEQMPNLASADLSGSANAREIFEFAEKHKEIDVTCDIEIFGHTYPYSIEELMVVGEWSRQDILDSLALLPNLQSINLQSCHLTNIDLFEINKRYPTISLICMVDIFGRLYSSTATSLKIEATGINGDELVSELSNGLVLFPTLTSVDLNPLGTALDPKTIYLLQQEFPSISFLYSFQLRGHAISTSDEMVDLYEALLTNDDLPQIILLLKCLKKCTYVDMAYTQVDNSGMEELIEEFPDIHFSWIIHFSSYYCRTDADMIKASNRIHSFDSKEAEVLKYCTSLQYLDLGHNELTDISFLSNMANLKVLILAISHNITDISPLAGCVKLEYLELFSNNIVDISPLSNLLDLKHLNICNNQIDDASALYNLHNLERLWISNNPLSDKQKEQLILQLPNCDINFTTSNPTAEGWKKGPRYDLLCEQFLYGTNTIYSRLESYNRP